MSTAPAAGSPAGQPAEQLGTYPATELSTPTRGTKRAAYDRATVHAILDQGFVCHLGYVRDGAPVVLPTLYARSGERLYVHGSTGSRPLRGASGGGLPVCLTVTHVDGLVLAKSAFHHSVNYRSVVVHGTAYDVTDPGERAAALDAIVDQAVPGRSADTRPPNAKELAATAVVRLDLREVSAKVRTGGPSEEPEDVTLPYWSGVVPLVSSYGVPEPAALPGRDAPVPDYLPPARR